MISIRPSLLNMFFLAGKISQALNKVCTQTPHPGLNNNELNSLYVNEPGLYAIILGFNKPTADVGSFLFSGVYLDVSCEAAAVHALLTDRTCSLRV